MNKATERSVYVPIRISPTQNQKLEALARQTKKSKSALVRRFIDKGLSVDCFEADEENMLLTIRKALAMELKQPIERLAAISAKGTHISAGNFFMAVQIARLLVTTEDEAKVNSYANKARRLGIEYLKEPELSVDAFIDNALSNRFTK